jgi:hypothetical protein
VLWSQLTLGVLSFLKEYGVFSRKQVFHRALSISVYSRMLHMYYVFLKRMNANKNKEIGPE